MTLDEIRAALQHRKISSVAKATGLTRTSLYNIMNGATVSPRLHVYEKLVEYFSRKVETTTRVKVR
jgi:DNA-binding phage protein